MPAGRSSPRRRRGGPRCRTADAAAMSGLSGSPCGDAGIPAFRHHGIPASRLCFAASPLRRGGDGKGGGRALREAGPGAGSP
ncbi:hypothetical protein WS86_26690 [Burkholderia savannae]|nr:hypothetical protein WS86_26690 [Burkholderia savannae]KWZ48069.1 hypothetical protein WS73_05980 [Burkholderia savannae]